METPKAIYQDYRNMYTRRYPNPKSGTLKRTMARYVISRRGVEKERTPLNEIISGLAPRPIMKKKRYEEKTIYDLN